MDFGRDVGKWKGDNYESKIAHTIKRQEQTKKPDAYKSINSSSIRKELTPPQLKIALDIIYSA
jgi:hypothetical protein